MNHKTAERIAVNPLGAAQPGLCFQKRDGAILEALYRYDGVLGRRHIQQIFWSRSSRRSMDMRLARLHRLDYIAWPSLEQRRTRPIAEPAVWLGWRGMLWLAAQRGAIIPVPQRVNESQFRKLEGQLKRVGIRWVREPRWFQLEHDLAIVDVRLAVERAALETGTLQVEHWVTEGEFLSQMDTVQYWLQDRSAKPRAIRRGVRPDGYFVIRDARRQSDGLPSRARFLLEVDRASHDTASFIKEKVLAGQAYLHSDAYRERFGDNTGRWLVVTTGEVRLNHLMGAVSQAVGNSSEFWFSTLDLVITQSPLTTPIWHVAGQNGLQALFPKGSPQSYMPRKHGITFRIGGTEQ